MAKHRTRQLARGSAEPRQRSSKSVEENPTPPGQAAPSPPRRTLPLFPTPKREKVPRVAVSLKPETRAALAEIAALQKRPMATVAADLLDEMGPTLTRLADVLRAAAAASATFPKASVEKLDRMVDALAMTAEGAFSAMEREVGAASGQQAQKGRGRRRGH